MTVADITKNEGQGQSIGALAGAIGQSVSEFSSAFLSRVSANSSSVGRRRQLQMNAAKTKEHLSVLMRAAANAEDDENGTKASMASDAIDFVARLDDFLGSLEQDLLLYSGAGREWRRSNAGLITVTGKMRETMDELREIVMGFVEAVDPTPENYLEEEMQRIYGDEAESVRSSFEYLATSENFSKDAFKRRHALK